MTFNKGDRVRVTAVFEDRIDADGDIMSPQGGVYFDANCPGDGVTVELVERAKPVDDPARDPIGTVRQNTGFLGGVYIKARGGWTHIEGGFAASGGTLGEIVGVLPGTPAAEVPESKLRAFQDRSGDRWYEESDGVFSVYWGPGKVDRSGYFRDYTLARVQAECGPLTAIEVGE